MSKDTNEQFKGVLADCRALFAKKLHDYGAAWRVMRPTSVTDQIFIKAMRIQTLETTGKSLVGDGIQPEFVAIVNYAIVAMIQCSLGISYDAAKTMTVEEALAAYDHHANASLELMMRKNHDYGEAWRNMRVSSFTDIILQKLLRTKQIEDLEGQTLVSEGVEANYQDMMNYAMFALIKFKYGD
ncbi:MAG: DUF1599 domain-containing protein [Bacteroidaceae bacterium]|nr:DUF1599 domain-containing protein [Bacteroidaceae bacterium]